ncbi:5-oxoprolinase subunit PxpA [Pseudozobellia sp. WGM2]|uniref:5-oxoprolinase subunit PxpA n=1 Tax=Pseudozobellia sp. WGM2 TaxID=2787625 RepID=UPI001AE0A05B|nr:5-oxoprolinase subunit PxpA [Pseudozobellia sp. WGM2]
MIEINCDAGESSAGEERLFPLITSCSIACGGHIGDQVSMEKTVRLAKQYQVKVGAHPSYPDPDNFGRVSIDISEKKLVKSIKEQIRTLIDIIENEDVQLDHIKAHGALYNDMNKNSHLAKLFLSAIVEHKSTTHLLVPYGSEIENEAIEQGFQIKYEAFADRNYNADLSLVARSNSNALIKNPQKVLEHILLIKNKGQVKTINGELKEIKADTFCIHGDTSAAFEIVSYIRQQFPNPNPRIK